MNGTLQGRRVAVLVDNEGVEQVELSQPVDALLNAGAQVDLIAPEAGEIQAFDHLDKSGTFDADLGVSDADPGDYAGLVLPGGVANPDNLRTDPEAVEFVRSFFSDGKPVAAICHAPWMLVEAGVVEGRTLTSWPSLRSVAGEAVEQRCGDCIRAAEASHYSNLLFEVRPFETAAAVIEWLAEQGYRVVLASSAKASEVEHYLKLIGASPGPHAVTQGDEVDATKPEPELVERVLSEAGAAPERALMVGDSVWDVAAAYRAGVETVAVRTGGFPAHELLDRGARAVLD